MTNLLVNRPIRYKIVVCFVSSFVLSYLLVTYVFFTDQPRLRPEFVRHFVSIRNLSFSTLIQLPQRLVKLPKKFIPQKPVSKTKLPSPWFFVPPKDWIVQPPNRDRPPYHQPRLIPTATPLEAKKQPTQPPYQPPSGLPTRQPSPTVFSGQAPSQAANKLLSLINNERRSQGIGELKFDNRLNQAAQNYADVVGSARVCSHTYQSTPSERFKAAGYPSPYGGENITCGIADPQAAFNAWLGSSGHRANMLNPSYKSAGLGFSSGYWVLDLGSV